MRAAGSGRSRLRRSRRGGQRDTCAMLRASMARDGGFGEQGHSASRGNESTPDPARPIGGFGPPGGVPPLGGPMTPGSTSEVATTLPLVLAIASTLLCCDPILGLPAIILAIQARNAANMGAVDVARRRARAALVLAFAAMGVGLMIQGFEAARYLGLFDAGR